MLWLLILHQDNCRAMPNALQVWKMGGVSQYIPQWLWHHSTTIITKIFRVCAGLPRSPMVSADLTWSPLVSRALCWSQWSPLVSSGLPWSPVVYLGLQWSLLVCKGLNWSLGSLLVSLVSRGLCWYSNTFWIFGWLFGMAWWHLRLWSCPGSLAFPHIIQPAGLAVSESCSVMELGPVKSAMVCSGVHIRHITER